MSGKSSIVAKGGAQLRRAARVALLALGGVSGALAQSAPSFWDPALHLEKPEIAGLRAIRFLTADDYPPLEFSRADGSLAGFNVEIARAICDELRIGCTIQARRWDTLVDSLESGAGDAMVASLAVTPALRERIDFTQPYYLTPGRFAVRKAAAPLEISPNALAGRKIGVIAGSAHEAFVATYFPQAARVTFPGFPELHDAIAKGAVDAVFADGLTLAVWLAGESSADCCAFRGGPFLESRFFGEGVGVAVRKDDDDLRRALDWALARVAARGTYAEIYRKYFPVGFY